MKHQKGFTLLEMVFAVLIIAGIVGWVLNVIDIVHAISDPLTGMFVLRCVGVFVAPLGAVLGYF